LAKSNHIVSLAQGSFRDKRNFVIEIEDRIIRVLDDESLLDISAFIKTDLYSQLNSEKKIVDTNYVEDIQIINKIQNKNIVEHNKIDFLSYVHEWTFNMLKDAALLTLEIQNRLLKENFSLKDASPYNIQFVNSHPVFIDLGSIEKYNDEAIWYGYQQFCQMFLYPLILCAGLNLNIQDFYSNSTRGISAKNTWKLLKFSHKRKLRNIIHVKGQSGSNNKTNKVFEIEAELKKAGFSKKLRIKQIDALKKIIMDLDKPNQNSKWSDYSKREHYKTEELKDKEKVISDVVGNKKYSRVIDWGSNDGLFSKKVISESPQTNCLAIDSDPEVVDKLYVELRETNLSIQPLVVDICNPTPAFGWGNTERESFINRIKPDLNIAYALIHHLFITENIPWSKIVELFARSGNLIIEFPHIVDSKVLQLIKQKKEPELYKQGYDKNKFESELLKYYKIIKTIGMETRTIYYCENINDKK